MKRKYFNKTAGAFFFFGFPALLLISCGEETNQWDTVLFEKGTFGSLVNDQERAETDVIAIEEGTTVKFTDLSNKIFTRNWVFQGGTPETSSDSIVQVTYNKPGDFKATLTVKYRDNQTKKISYDVSVAGIPSGYGDTYGIFTDDPKIDMMPYPLVVDNTNQFPGVLVNDAYEGNNAYKFDITGNSDWAMAYLTANRAVDLSAFSEGFYNLAIRSTSEGNILIRLRSNGGGNAILRFTAEGEEYGFKRDGAWHMLKIPVAEIRALDANFRITEVTDFVLLRSEGDVRTYSNYTFYLDHIFFSTE